MPEARLTRQNEVLERAALLLGQAHAELAEGQPDWPAVVTLAERCQRLTASLQSPAEAAPEVGDAVAEALGPVVKRAKAARDRALALSWSVTESSLSPGTRLRIDAAEQAYQRALALQQGLSSSGADQPAAVATTVEAFRHAEDLAVQAYDAAWREVSHPSRTARGEQRDYTSDALIGGAVTIIFDRIFGSDV